MKRADLRILLCVGFAALSLPGAPVGVFENSGDVGITPSAGNVEFNASSGEYRVTGGGANVWAKADAFQFLWKRVTGDVTLTADVQFVGASAIPHRKAMLMIRQSLEPDAAYADVARHGEGLTSLQYRPEAGALTAEIRAQQSAPSRLRIERRGDKFTIFVGKAGEELQPVGPTTLALKDPVYVGLGVCSHKADVLETAIFSNVKLEARSAAGARPNQGPSHISVYDLSTGSVNVVYNADRHFEAPNWSPDGKYLLLNAMGSLWRLALDSKPAARPVKIELGSITDCNNDHGISPDGKMLAISAAVDRKSQVFLAATDGSGGHQMTTKAPSYYHGWSPDGKWLAFVGQRDGNFDLYRMAVTGGEEQRLTSNAGYDDGPDYSRDGKWIYFNSDRSGSWDVWRIPASGAGTDDKLAQRVTSDEYEDWFPHCSPDGKWLVFISFPKGTKGHPAGQHVVLRMMPMPGAKLKPAPIKELVKLFGGQGTMNVNSWSPDSKKFAFVSYDPN